MAKIEPATVAIAAAAAYFLFRPKESEDGASDGGCGTGFIPGPDGFCVPEQTNNNDITFENKPGVPDDNFGGDATPFDSDVGQGFAPTPDPDTTGPGGFATLPGDPAQPLPPAIDYQAVFENNYSETPRAGFLYQVKAGDNFKKIAEQALFDAAYSSGFAQSANPTQAQQIAQQAANSGSFRLQYRELIYCSPWNDYLYGTHAYGPGTPASSLTGRAIRLRPKQIDNVAQIAGGNPPARNERWGKPADQNKGGKSPVNAGQNSYELLWLPGINLDKIVKKDILTNTLSLGVLETYNYPQSQWTSVVPPGPIWDLGILDYDDQNAPGSVGCGYYEADIGP